METNTTPDTLKPRARKKLERDIAEAACKNDPTITFGVRKHSAYYKDCCATLSKYSTETLYRLQHVATIKDMGIGLFGFLAHTSPTEEVINDWCILRQNIAKTTMLEAELMRHINALPYYEHLEPQKAGHYPQKRIDQGTAIIRVTKHLNSRGITTHVKNQADAKLSIEYIKDRKLRDLLTMSTDPQHTADIIITRGLINAKEVKEALATMVSIPATLTEGTL